MTHEELGPSAEILRRRQVAAQVRRRRLLLADLGLGLLLALLALLIAPGLAWVALVALAVLAGYGGWGVCKRLRRARRGREGLDEQPAVGTRTRYRVGSRHAGADGGGRGDGR